MKETSNIGLKFVKLYGYSVRDVVLSDTSFAIEAAMISQLGFVILMVDDHSRTNKVHYGSNRCHNVSQFVIAAEVHAFAYVCDNAYIVLNTF